eukprot:1136585-Pelagomonas_calceolata.AAC.1
MTPTQQDSPAEEPPGKRTRLTMKHTSTPMPQPSSQILQKQVLQLKHCKLHLNTLQVTMHNGCQPDRQHPQPSYSRHSPQPRYANQQTQNEEGNSPHTVAELTPLAINPLGSPSQGFEVRIYRKTSVQKLAKAKTASHFIDVIQTRKDKKRRQTLPTSIEKKETRWLRRAVSPSTTKLQNR